MKISSDYFIHLSFLKLNDVMRDYLIFDLINKNGQKSSILKDLNFLNF